MQKIPVQQQQQQHTAQSGQVMLPQANRQWLYWERHVSAPNNNVLYCPFLRDFLILYLSLLWAINHFAVTKWFNLSRSLKSWKKIWSYSQRNVKRFQGIEIDRLNITLRYGLMHNESLPNLSSKAPFFMRTCHCLWNYSFERLRNHLCPTDCLKDILLAQGGCHFKKEKNFISSECWKVKDGRSCRDCTRQSTLLDERLLICIWNAASSGDYMRQSKNCSTPVQRWSTS